ncbi:MAG: putative Ntn-hydrolase superfamily protein [Roseivirga sp.]|jgi:uncharacterized Ntn-hydrolase superfamily protein
MKRLTTILLTTFLLVTCLAVSAQVFKTDAPLAHTYSIVARDAKTGEMAVGVQSHWFSVGTSVSWGEAGVGVVATQSFTNKSFGLRGLALLKEGKTAEEALKILLSDDEGEAVRQVAILDVNGNVAAHTGSSCIEFAGDIQGVNYSVQANMMLKDTVWPAMAKAFENSEGKPLAERVLLALEAAENEGGDIRGKQSAALMVVNGEQSNEPWNNYKINLRVDDSSAPLPELRRLYNVHVAYEHMNAGDLAVEKGDMAGALKEYGAAEQMFPKNIEMKYWKAIALANNGRVEEAMPIFKQVFKADKNWKTLSERLVPIGFLTVTEEQLEAILKL